MNEREQLISEIALSVAKGCSNEKICEKHNITPTQLKQIKNRRGFDVFVGAYQHKLRSSEYVEILTHSLACATIFLSYLIPDLHTRSGVLELLDVLLKGSEDPEEFLLKYEQLHGVKYGDLS